MSDDTKKIAEQPVTMKQMMDLIQQTLAVAVTTAGASKGPAQAAPPAPKSREKCSDCGQQKSGCEGKHIQMTVFPKSYADYFVGVVINGVKYLSNHENHKVTVPAACESTIQGIVNTFEKNEQELATGRKANRHSGQVGPNGVSVSQANAAWR